MKLNKKDRNKSPNWVWKRKNTQKDEIIQEYQEYYQKLVKDREALTTEEKNKRNSGKLVSVNYEREK